MESMIILQGIGERLPLGALWSTPEGFVVLMVLVVGGIGLASKSLAVGSMGGYLTFSFYAIYSDVSVLEPIFYTALTLSILGTAFKIWKLEGPDA